MDDSVRTSDVNLRFESLVNSEDYKTQNPNARIKQVFENLVNLIIVLKTFAIERSYGYCKIIKEGFHNETPIQNYL